MYLPFTELDHEKLTKANLKRVIVLVARWKRLAEALCTQENLGEVTQMEEELKRLMAGLGAKVDVSGSKASACTSPQDCRLFEN